MIRINLLGAPKPKNKRGGGSPAVVEMNVGGGISPLIKVVAVIAIASLGARYKNDPLVVLAGDMVRRKVDLTKLFPLMELGTYKVRPAIHFHETGKFYSAAATITTQYRLLMRCSNAIRKIPKLPTLTS